MDPQHTEALDYSHEPSNTTFLQTHAEKIDTTYPSDEKMDSLLDPPTIPSQAFDEEDLTKPKSRLLRICHALDAYIASFLIKREYTWRDYLLYWILGFVIGTVGALAWRWVTVGWRPWTRTYEEQVMYCRSSGVRSIFL